MRRTPPCPVPSLSLAALACCLLAGANARAAQTAGRFTRLAASGENLFAIRDGAFVILGTDGRVLGRCAALEPSPLSRRQGRTRTGAIDADDALRLAGLPDDDDSTPEAEDALADEGLGRARTASTATTPAPEVHDLAVIPGTDQVWIASSIGLYRSDRSGCRAAGLRGRDVVRVAAGASAIAAATDDLVWLFSPGGAVRVALAGLTSRPRALAVQEDGGVLVATDDGLLQLSPGGGNTTLLERGTDLVVVCAGTALAFAGDESFRWELGGQPERIGGRPPVRALACGPGEAERFLAAGLGVWTSPDGADWVEHPGGSPSSIAGVAGGARSLWLIAEDRLLILARVSSTGGRVPPAPLLPLARPPLAPLPTARLIAPTLPWPELALLAAAQRTPARWGWAVEVLIAFPLGRRGGHRADRQPVAAELLKRDHGLAAEEAVLSNAPWQDQGEENAAQMRALRQEREALR